MSSPSETSPERSVTVSSPLAANAEYEDTASSTQGTGPPPTVQYVGTELLPSAPQEIVPAAPNTVFSSRARTVRARSASPRPRRTITPTALSVAHQRARTAEMKADTAFSSVGMVADETRRVRNVAEEAIAEARSLHAEIESKMGEVVSRVDVSASNVADSLTGQVREAVAHSDEMTNRAVGDLQNRTREFVEGHRRALETKIATNQEEARRSAQETKTAVDNLSVQLAQLTAQLAEMKPARSDEVATGHQALVHDFGQRIEVQNTRIDTVSDSVQRIQIDTADNTKLLHDLLLNMENLGESVKNLKTEMAEGWEQEDESMVYEEEKEHQQLQAALLQEVSTSFPHSEPAVTMVNTMPMPVSLPVAMSVSMNEASSSSLPTGADEEMQRKLDGLRMPVIHEDTEKEKQKKEKGDIPFEFTPLSSPMHYPGLDGHQRRIAPTPINRTWEEDRMENGVFVADGRRVGTLEPVKSFTDNVDGQVPEKAVKIYKNVNVSDVMGGQQATSSRMFQSSEVSRPTIGTTTVSSSEAEKIRDEVRSELRRMFPGIAQFEAAAAEGEKREEPSRPEAIAGSEVSMASSHSKSGVGESHNSFSRLMSSGPEPTGQTFSNVQWRPKEPPCYYGKSSEDVHMWTSLVRHYLAFMGGNDLQQVAYAVTLLRDAAHEWFTAYERKNHGLPRDWAQLSMALLERFGSTMRSQEAQSQLMSISQGTRPVREYASQFEMLLGRLESYDENMLLNQFVWGLQPELARSVSLHYPKSIAQAVSLAETTELAVRASRRPATKGQTGRAPMQQNQGRGQWKNRGRGGYRGGRGQGSGGRRIGGGGRRGGRTGSSYASYDPLACYRCGVRGHLARDCPQQTSSQGSGISGPFRGKTSQSVQKGTRGRGRGGRPVRFSGLNVVYDEQGNQYPIDDAGQLYVPLETVQAVGESAEEEKSENTKN